jgi:hemoglobin
MATLYDRLGREGGIAKAVDEFYDRVVADSDLCRRFEDVDMDRLRRHQLAFLVAATGGPRRYTGADMATAHSGVRVTSSDFDRVVDHLMSTLRDLGLDEGAVGEVVGALAPLREIIIAA